MSGNETCLQRGRFVRCRIVQLEGIFYGVKQCLQKANTDMVSSQHRVAKENEVQAFMSVFHCSRKYTDGKAIDDILRKLDKVSGIMSYVYICADKR